MEGYMYPILCSNFISTIRFYNLVNSMGGNLNVIYQQMDRNRISEIDYEVVAL